MLFQNWNNEISKLLKKKRKPWKKNFILSSLVIAFLLTLFIQIIMIGSISCANEPNQKVQSKANLSKDNGILYSKQYQNLNYLYSILIPQGCSCLGSSAPNPNHGCIIYLSNNPETNIYVDGSYNSADFISPGDYLWKIFIDKIFQEKMEITVLIRVSTTLGGLEAERIAFKYKQKSNNETVITDVVAAFREEKGDSEMIYTACLKTRPDRYQKDKELFENVLDSWKNLPCHK